MNSQKHVEFKMPPNHTVDELKDALARELNIAIDDLPEWTIVRRSIDARRKSSITLNYSIQTGPAKPLAGLSEMVDSDRASGRGKNYSDSKAAARPVIVGFGPAGIFAALYLARAGLKPIVLERGNPVEKRQSDVDNFWNLGILNTESNVQFGEGGAGTFSDGKLTTRIKDNRCRLVMEELVIAGAPTEILYLAKPHIGTDILRDVVRNIRKEIIALGGEIRFGCRLDSLDISGSSLRGLVYSQDTEIKTGQGRAEYLAVEHLILAPGHSARDTFEMLQRHGVEMMQKPFAVGMRIEHPQNLIDWSQYGNYAASAVLGPAEYKLAARLPSGRSVYSFCMCPGGEVILASSEEGSIVTNGMSYHDRSQPAANSALLVNVDPSDFPSESPLAGIEFQRRIEQKAWKLTGGRYAGISQKLKNLLNPDNLSENSGRGQHILKQAGSEPIESSCRPETSDHHISELLPDFVWKSIVEAIPEFDRRLHGFAWGEAVLTGPETRSSSPLRIVRTADCQSSVEGLIPCGEGAGYAGGIISSAVDGIKCAQALVML